jgi:hypothetical protein
MEQESSCCELNAVLISWVCFFWLVVGWKASEVLTASRNEKLILRKSIFQDAGERR